MGTLIGPGRKLVDRIQNRDLYHATEKMQPYGLRDESNIILLWKKFLISKLEEPNTFLPMNGVFDNLTQIKTEEFAQKNKLPYTPGQLDKQLLEATYKTFPDDKFLNAIIKNLRSSQTIPHILPSEDPFSEDIYSQIEPEYQQEYLRKHIYELPPKYRKLLTPETTREIQETKQVQQTKQTKTKPGYGVSESDKKGIPFNTPDAKVYRIFKRLRNKYEGRISLDKHDTGNRNPNNVPGGGGTKFGITQANWDGYCMRNKLPLSPVTKITRQQAEKVGFEDYKKSGAYVLPPNTQLAVADYHFNSGPGNMVIALREILGLPPIQIQGLPKKQLIALIKQQKKELYELLNEKIKTQKDDEKYAALIYAARVKLLSGSKTRKKTKQLVHNRGLLDRIDEMAEITGNETILNELSSQMKDMTSKQRLELLQKHNLDRARYYPLGYGNKPEDQKYRQRLQDET